MAQNQLSESAGIIATLQPRAQESSLHSDMLQKLKSAYSSVTQTFSHMQQAKVTQESVYEYALESEGCQEPSAGSIQSNERIAACDQCRKEHG